MSADYAIIARRIVWRLLGDLAASSPTAVLRAAEVVAAEDLERLYPAPGRVYRIMAEIARAGENPTAESVMARALRNGHLHDGGDALKRVVVTLATAPGEPLTLPTSVADAAGVILRADADAFAYALKTNAESLGAGELIRAIRGGCEALIAAVDHYATAATRAGLIDPTEAVVLGSGEQLAIDGEVAA